MTKDQKTNEALQETLELTILWSLQAFSVWSEPTLQLVLLCIVLSGSNGIYEAKDSDQVSTSLKSKIATCEMINELYLPRKGIILFFLKEEWIYI